MRLIDSRSDRLASGFVVPVPLKKAFELSQKLGILQYSVVGASLSKLYIVLSSFALLLDIDTSVCTALCHRHISCTCIDISIIIHVYDCHTRAALGCLSANRNGAEQN